MKPTLTHPTYDDIDRACNVITQQILKMGAAFYPTTIVALSRGGLLPGVIISHLLENLEITNTVVPVVYSSKIGKGDNKNHTNILPPLPTMNVLVVDDITDGGRTLQEVTTFYRQQGYIVRSAVLYYKESSVHVPTFYWQKIPANSPWIVFPFEV